MISGVYRTKNGVNYHYNIFDDNHVVIWQSNVLRFFGESEVNKKAKTEFENALIAEYGDKLIF